MTNVHNHIEEIVVAGVFKRVLCSNPLMEHLLARTFLVFQIYRDHKLTLRHVYFGRILQ